MRFQCLSDDTDIHTSTWYMCKLFSAFSQSGSTGVLQFRSHHSGMTVKNWVWHSTAPPRMFFTNPHCWHSTKLEYRIISYALGVVWALNLTWHILFSINLYFHSTKSQLTLSWIKKLYQYVLVVMAAICGPFFSAFLLMTCLIKATQVCKIPYYNVALAVPLRVRCERS